MPYVCGVSGKRTSIGKQYKRRGLAKAKGGVGQKVTGKTRRTFKPNLQRIRVIVDGKRTRMYVAAKYIRRGMVTKPVRRRFTAPA